MTNNPLKTFVFTYDYEVTARTLKEAKEYVQLDEGFYVRPDEFVYTTIRVPTIEDVSDYQDDIKLLIDDMYKELSSVTDPIERKILVRAIHKTERRLENI